MAPPWKLDGLYAEACTCEAARPRIMLSDPSEGSGTALVGWEIEHRRARRRTGANRRVDHASPDRDGVP